MNRRGLLAVIAAAPVVAVPTAAIASPSVAWDRLMAQRDAAEVEYRSADTFYNPGSDVEFDRLDQLCERFCNLEDQLMQMPAPHLRALRWKLDLLLRDDEDRTTASWATSYVEQTRRDIARLLV